MAAPAFARGAGEKMVVREGEPASAANALVGDAFRAEGPAGATRVWLVGAGGALEAQEYSGDPDVKVGTSISRHLADPVAFFGSAGMVTLVELATPEHAELLRKCSGGRPVKRRTIYYDLHAGEAIFWRPTSPDAPLTRREVLSVDTPAEYLTDEQTLLWDPRVAAERKEHRVLHEEHATAFFRSRALGARIFLRRIGGTIADRRLPFRMAFYDIDSHDGSCCDAPEGGARTVRLRHEAVFHLVTFTLKLSRHSAGPVGGIRVWVDDGEQFFIDLREHEAREGAGYRSGRNVKAAGRRA